MIHAQAFLIREGSGKLGTLILAAPNAFRKDQLFT
jgi:hypothetical protein